MSDGASFLLFLAVVLLGIPSVVLFFANFRWWWPVLPPPEWRVARECLDLDAAGWDGDDREFQHRATGICVRVSGEWLEDSRTNRSPVSHWHARKLRRVWRRERARRLREKLHASIVGSGS